MNYDSFELINNESGKRFEFTVDGSTAFILYKKIGEKELELFHTEVPESLEGKGVGKALAQKALQYCKTNGIKILPTCPFLAAYIQRHPEWNSIVINSAS